jgi:hypothetical protein
MAMWFIVRRRTAHGCQSTDHSREKRGQAQQVPEASKFLFLSVSITDGDHQLGEDAACYVDADIKEG